MVILYSRVGCKSCQQAKHWLDTHGIIYEARDTWYRVYTDEALAYGCTLPILVTPEGHVVGYRPQLFKEVLQCE